MSHAPLTLLVAGTCSGSGKTTLALSLMAALRQRGLTVQAFKAGPDFIDPGHHAAITKRPSCNLDTWMAGEAGVCAAWAHLLQSQPKPDFLLGEGVMGLFDGAAGLGGLGSTAHLARLLHVPLLLVVDARGMGQSTAALAHGFTSLQSDLHFAGMVCTHVGGESHASMLREAFATVFGQGTSHTHGLHNSHKPNSSNDSPSSNCLPSSRNPHIPLLGLLPRKGAPKLTSRHLGLTMAHEHNWDTPRLHGMIRWLEEHMDVDALLKACVEHSLLQPKSVAPATSTTSAKPALSAPPTPRSPACESSRPRIAIARDEAFCFLYAHMPMVLEELGAECVFFSPLRDTSLPDNCRALYFPGGYPELHAQALATNTVMHESVRAFAALGKRIYGECGGYMYLMESIEVAGQHWAMSGCLPLRCRLEEQRVALGYRELTPFEGQKMVGRGHEFHYSRLLEASPTTPLCSPLWQVRDRKGCPLPPEGARYGNVYGSWVHLCPYGGRELLAYILQL